MKLARITTTLTVPFALALASCSAVTSGDSFTELAEPTGVTQIANDQTESSEVQPAEPSSAPTDATVNETTSKPPAQKPKNPDCAQLPNDPRKVFPTGTAPGRMPAVNNGDYNFWISDIENYYDPCAPVSWIIFHGQLGDFNGPAGTAASVTDGLAIYLNGKPDGEMRIFGRIDNVSASPDNSISLSWSERTRSTAEGYTANYLIELDTSGGTVTPEYGNGTEFKQRWDDPAGAYMLGTYD